MVQVARLRSADFGASSRGRRGFELWEHRQVSLDRPG